MPELDAEVLSAAQSGAGWAFERVYNVLAPAVHGYLRAQRIDDPEGAVNDVFLRAFRSMPGFDGSTAAFRSWVFAIAHNLVIDERRFASRRPRETSVERLPERLSSTDPEADVLRTEGLTRLLAQLDLLTREQRDVLLLRFVADLSTDETARALGRSPGAVKALQHRALESVRRRLEVAGDLFGQPVSRDVQPTFTLA